MWEGLKQGPAVFFISLERVLVSFKTTSVPFYKHLIKLLLILFARAAITD